MDTSCLTDSRRDAVRRQAGRNGLDYVELGDDGLTLHAYFLGKLPVELSVDAPDLPRLLAIEGGDVITGLRILDADPVVDPDPERDDFLVLRLDRSGDRSRYTLRLVGVAGIDPFYASADFSFGIDCPIDLDCLPVCDCESPALDEPPANYLAKDYASLRQLIFDRLALLLPDWRERHVPDLGVTLVEVLAYVGDHLSYAQDAVATEAYLDTARQRISVRRHARLVDYLLHEGCNARAWVHVDVDTDTPPLPADQLGFLTAWRDGLTDADTLVRPEQLDGVPASAFECFEPLLGDPAATLTFRAAHSRIAFYTWGRRSCCLGAGSTEATLLDAWRDDGTRQLELQPGDWLVLAEVRGARTGLAPDADPSRRWAVRLTEVTPDEDPLYPQTVGGGEFPATRPTPVLRVRWHVDDALPFALCLSAIGHAPACDYLDEVSVAWGNIVLVDHGCATPGDTLGPVPQAAGEACCECEGQPSDIPLHAARFRPLLTRQPLTHAEAAPDLLRPAARSLTQDPRLALPRLQLVELDDAGGAAAVWAPRHHLLTSGPDERHFVAEIDNVGRAHLRFGDGELGRQPDPGTSFDARYRIGQGRRGNVGAEAIRFIVLRDRTLDGVTFRVRNPLPAQGGIDAESIAEAKRFAPMAFRRELLRAITADDYATIAARHPALQGTQAALVWTGSWNEAVVALDPWRRHADDPAVAAEVQALLERVRRMGHDLRVGPADYVPITLGLHVCAQPGHERGRVEAALLKRFVGPGGFFDGDQLAFGQGLQLSRIIAAAMQVSGVACVTVTELHRTGEPPNHEIENGLLPLAPDQIAELANDPNHPERGVIHIVVEGGL